MRSSEALPTWRKLPDCGMLFTVPTACRRESELEQFPERSPLSPRTRLSVVDRKAFRLRLREIGKVGDAVRKAAFMPGTHL